MREMKHEPIPLPPILLTVIPFLTMVAGGLIAILIVPMTLAAFIGAALGFAVPLVWLARRTRG